ncbi:nucleotidyltransferase domain-containing protein [Nocardioides sp.]|uniref:nucleotidyltransferase domain-containing protein n=1 Tax=Nocardioides sp. TaxID=35761 RepID=UPI002D7FB539|nr:nucleotidyltransferase domain-containing protein [Nocardioides sp.]HET8960742.1 nucleotidyltransferase domain-containing protein [Nocardioides sp.]
MQLEQAVTTARALVAERFPGARAAWLAGSVVAGTATASSDLDITVLLPGPPAPFRESLVHDGWPVELFVHTRESVARWIAQDLERRRPTLVRLISSGVVLLDVDGSGAALSEECAEVLAAGPGPPSDATLDWMRYGLTDMLDDLADSTEPLMTAAIAVATWEAAARLLLAADARWWGTSKWLVRELREYDAVHATTYALRLHAGLAAAFDQAPDQLLLVAEEILDSVGGRLWAGYRAEG